MSLGWSGCLLARIILISAHVLTGFLRFFVFVFVFLIKQENFVPFAVWTQLGRTCVMASENIVDAHAGGLVKKTQARDCGHCLRDDPEE